MRSCSAAHSSVQLPTVFLVVSMCTWLVALTYWHTAEQSVRMMFVLAVGTANSRYGFGISIVSWYVSMCMPAGKPVLSDESTPKHNG